MGCNGLSPGPVDQVDVAVQRVRTLRQLGVGGVDARSSAYRFRVQALGRRGAGRGRDHSTARGHWRKGEGTSRCTEISQSYRQEVKRFGPGAERETVPGGSTDCPTEIWRVF